MPDPSTNRLGMPPNVLSTPITATTLEDLEAFRLSLQVE
jgi:hypothetical protein